MQLREKKWQKKKDSSLQGSPAWMNTYADMVTLLLAFFVLLYSFSAIDVERFREVMSALQHSFMGRTGILEGTPDPGSEEGERLDRDEMPGSMEEIVLGEREQAMLEKLSGLEETYEDIVSFLQEAGMEDDIRLHLEERGIVIELPEKVLFDIGRAEIKTEFISTLDLLAEVLADIDNRIIVEGHTDNVPISTLLYPTNWELSVARAVSVARFFVEGHGLEPKRFVAKGYGEFNPVDTNETPEGRARNRRVNIVVSIFELEGD